MSNPFNIVKDSSIWQNSKIYSAVSNKDPYLRIGIVKKVFREQVTSDLRYLVEIQDRNDSVEVTARLLRKFGGVFNYEDIVEHGYKIDDKPDPVRAFDAKAGDTVLVAFLNGEAREAIILGGLTHPARKSTIDITKGPQYSSEFNGIETTINENGEYKLTFKAIPTNIKKLDEKPDKTLPKPIYDEKIGGSFLKLDKTGSIELNDKDQDGFQSIKINKPDGQVVINSGNIVLTMIKKDELVELKCKAVNIESENTIDIKTKQTNINSSEHIKINSPKVAIGKDGIELLDQLFQLIQMLGTVTPISPIGPCTSLKATPQWSQVVNIQSKIKDITGNLN